jgi:hypothetical protein
MGFTMTVIKGLRPANSDQRRPWQRRSRPLLVCLLTSISMAGVAPAAALAHDRCCAGAGPASGAGQINPRQTLPSAPASSGGQSSRHPEFSYVPPAPTNPYQNSGPTGASYQSPLGMRQSSSQWVNVDPVLDRQTQVAPGGWNYYWAAQVTCVPENGQNSCTFPYPTPVIPGTRCHCGQYAGMTR